MREKARSLPEVDREEFKDDDSEYIPNQNQANYDSDVVSLSSSVKTGKSVSYLSSSLKNLINRAS